MIDLNISAALPVPRAPVQWYGGKGHIKAKLMSLIPPGGYPYCEPYGGSGGILLSREPAPVEVWNDLHQDLANLMRCLQQRELFDDLNHRLTWTLYSRAEFVRALAILSTGESDEVTRAWAFFVAQNQGFSGNAKSAGDWGRVFTSHGGMAKTANSWLMRLALLDAWRLRLQRVQVDCRDALEVIRYWDSPKTVFYLDPPYPSETRAKGSRNNYTHETADEHHQELITTILGCRGAVCLSGYDTPLYAALDEAGWNRTEFKTACNAAGRVRGSGLQGKGSAMAKVPRTEVLWRNPLAVELCEKGGNP